MPEIEGWDGSETSTVDYNPFMPKYQDPPTPPIYNYPGNYGRGGYGGSGGPGFLSAGDYQGGSGSQVQGTDWEYPNWLIRMAQWRNF